MIRRLLTLSTLAAVATSASIAGAQARTATRTVRVTASEFKFRLSARTVRKGTVVFKVKNAGKLRHDFKIDGKKTPMLRPGKTATLKVVFRRSGKYHYLCTVPGHATLGMKGTLRVR